MPCLRRKAVGCLPKSPLVEASLVEASLVEAPLRASPESWWAQQSSRPQPVAALQVLASLPEWSTLVGLVHLQSWVQFAPRHSRC